MCYICSCFVYALDIIQRVITFGLLCLLSGAVCFGFSVAIIAGIAYGYNYSLAEFMTFTRSDVTVFMRRGQFYDKPELPMSRRRADEGEDNFFASNGTVDYDETGSKTQPLSDAWLKTHDTRKYAEKLTKYSPNKLDENFVLRPQDPIQFMPEVVTIVPSLIMPTVTWPSSSPELLLRDQKPLQDVTSAEERELRDDLLPSTDISLKSFGYPGNMHEPNTLTDSKLHTDDIESYVPPRVWTTTRRHVFPEYVTEDIDEENIAYKPV